MRTLLLALGVTVGVWAAVVLILFAIGWKRTREFAALLPNLLALLRGLLRDKRIPGFSRFLLLLALVWVASPIDLIPEFIPILGPLDDVIVITLVLRHLVRRAGPEIVAEHWHGTDQGLRAILRLAGAPRTS